MTLPNVTPPPLPIARRVAVLVVVTLVVLALLQITTLAAAVGGQPLAPPTLPLSELRRHPYEVAVVDLSPAPHWSFAEPGPLSTARLCLPDRHDGPTYARAVVHRLFRPPPPGRSGGDPIAGDFDTIWKRLGASH